MALLWSGLTLGYMRLGSSFLRMILGVDSGPVFSTFAELKFTNLRQRLCFLPFQKQKYTSECLLLEPRGCFLPHIKRNEMRRALIKHERLRCEPGNRALNGIWRSQLVGGLAIICQAIRNRFLLTD